jgi:hypothetical protein
MQNVIFLSSGITSWVAGLRTVERYGPEQCIGLFADTGVEDPDNYRFLEESTAVLGIPLVKVDNGEDLWGNWERHNSIPNNRMAFCSQDLKQEPSRRWLKENTSPETHRLIVGISWDEVHRIPAIEKGWAPYQVQFPMTEAPLLDKPTTLQIARDHGIEPPRLYRYGLPHANCGGGCVRAGMAQWRHVLEALPEVFALWERKEAEMQQQTGKNCTILKRSIRGQNVPYSLRELREEHERQIPLLDPNDWGGCGCFTDDYQKT